MSNEDEGAGSGTGCVRALSLVTCVPAGAVRVRRGVLVLSRLCRGGGPPQLQDVLVRLLEVVEGAEAASLDAGYVLLREVGVV